MNKLNFQVSTNLYDSGDAKSIFKLSMKDRFKSAGQPFSVWKNQVVIKLSRSDLFDIVEETLQSIAVKNDVDSPITHSTSYSAFNVEFSMGSSPEYDETMINNDDLIRVQMSINYNEDYECEPNSDGDQEQNEVLISVFEVYGCTKLVEDYVVTFKSLLRKKQEAGKSSLVNWIFADDSGARDKTFQIKKNWEIDRTLYPWIDTDLLSYYKAFMESRSQILVLYGVPGTGKTSFIRDLLCEMNLNAYISYDMKILTSDSTFVQYVTGSIFDAIVIEDADDLLTSERGDSNKIIAKILNVSDGLIKLPRKKLIFTTNLENVSDIDPAIIRPGRCFDVMKFREFSQDEAEIAAKTLGITLDKPKRCTLADLFYMKDLQECTDPFARSHGEQLNKVMGFY